MDSRLHFDVAVSVFVQNSIILEGKRNRMERLSRMIKAADLEIYKGNNWRLDASVQPLRSMSSIE